MVAEAQPLDPNDNTLPGGYQGDSPISQSDAIATKKNNSVANQAAWQRAIIVPDLQEDQIPTIVINGRPDRQIVADYIDAIIKSNVVKPWIFKRGPFLAYPRRGDGDLVYMEIIDEGAMDYILATVANTIRQEIKIQDSKPTVVCTPCAVPRRMLTMVMRQTAYHLPEIKVVTHIPGFRRDGTLFTEPGYDAASATYYDPIVEVPSIPEFPTPQEVADAVAALRDVLHFDFASETDFANAMALALTMIIRQTIDDSVPLAVVNAVSSKGTGKTFLIHCIHSMITGCKAPIRTMPAEETEMRKQITSAVEAAQDFICFDNVRGAVNSVSLESILTSLRWTDRLLGGNKMIDRDLKMTWAMTGNHVTLAGDIQRRSYFIHLDNKTAPEGRAYLATRRHPNLAQIIQERQPQLLAALLTMVRAWYAAGQPKPSQPTLLDGTYYAWSQMIGGILEHAQVPGFLATHKVDLDEQLEEDFEWEAFYLACHKQFGDRCMGAGEIVGQLDIEQDGRCLADYLPSSLIKEREKEHADKAFAVTLGRYFRNRKGHPIGESLAWVKDAGHDRHTKKVLWQFGYNASIPTADETSAPGETPAQTTPATTSLPYLDTPAGDVSVPLTPHQTEKNHHVRTDAVVAAVAAAPTYKPPSGLICPYCHVVTTAETISPCCPDTQDARYYYHQDCFHLLRPIVISGRPASWKDGGIYVVDKKEDSHAT